MPQFRCATTVRAQKTVGSQFCKVFAMKMLVLVLLVLR